MFNIIIEAKPFFQKRHRYGKGFLYDPSAKDKKNVRHIIRSQFKHKPIDSALDVHISFYFKPPKSYKNPQQYYLTPKTTKPDIDNLAKFYMDAMNGIVYTDDKLIYSLSLSKMYNNTDSVEISLLPID